MKKILKGQILEARSICDHECIFKAEILDRQKNFVTVKALGETKRIKVFTDPEGNEFIYAHGRHSMCPIFRAK